MTTTATPSYGTLTTVTITLASLAASATLVLGRQSTAIDNTSDLAIDAAVQFKVKTGGTPTSGQVIQLWCAPSADGTNFSGGGGASDASLTPAPPPPTAPTMVLLAQIGAAGVTLGATTTYHVAIASLASALGGELPPGYEFWVTTNCTGGLDSTAGNHFLKYRPTKYASA